MLQSIFADDPCLQNLQQNPHTPFSYTINNVVGSSSYLFLLHLFSIFKNVVFVVPSELELQKAHTFLKQFSSSLLSSSVSRFPDTGAALYERIPRPPELSAEQLSVLFDLQNKDKIIVTTPQALCAPVIQPKKLKDYSFAIHKNDQFHLEDIVKKLLQIGYRNCTVVERVGEFRRKGGILDVFSASHSYPIRIEMFDTEVESIRFFDPITQLSFEKTELVFFIPVHHFLCTESERDHVKTFIESAINTNSKANSAEIQQDIEVLSSENSVLNHLYYFPLIRNRECTLIDHLREDTCMVFLEMNRVQKALDACIEESREVHQLELEKKEVVSIDMEPYYKEIKEKIDTFKRTISLNPEPSSESTDNIYAFPTEEVNSPIKGDFQATIKQYLQNKGKVLVATRQPKRAVEIFDNYGFSSLDCSLQVEDIYMDTGFHQTKKNIAVFTDREIFGWKQPYKHYKKFREGTPIKSVDDLKMGDLLVHYSYGIGIYKGLSVLEGPEKKPKEFLLMEYKNGDELFIPPERIHMVNKYVGDSQHIALSSLGTSEWTRVKKKAKKGVELVAKELVELYAKKEASHGVAFSPDSPWQTEMETIFPYDETPDQIRTIHEVKQDMESNKIMDRIVTGDVGYGKTEVAIRATFKAIVDGYQVAILVPTTILANQHYENFKERYAPFPLEIAQMSRLVSPTDMKKNLQKIADGKIDLVIGTHRLLSKDVKFQKLGLLIIDEEHKFGVKHKEKIRMLRENIDVLTLTATPIPRTLSMALSGVRSISKIDTSPEGRKPVKTYVMPHDPEVLINAIQFEVSRGGQVYYVHNRIASIMDVQEDLQKRMPSLRIGVGHGQMSSEQLDTVITKFLQGELDVLLCTTIIESGIDIPTVNTLIVDHSDKLGLAQMYQLRGRVGRSNRRAYAYFFYPTKKVLTRKSISRLQAMQNFVELGSRLRIAMRDLQIRGAGTFLGTSQSGHLQSVGYHMYVQLLKEAVEKKKHPEKDISLDQLPEFPITGHIPNDFIRDEAERLSMYRELTAARTVNEIDNLIGEYQDRFGTPPLSLLELFDNLKLRIICFEKGMKEVKLERNRVFFYFLESSDRFSVTAKTLSSLCQKYGKRIHFFEGYIAVLKNSDPFNTVISEVMSCF